MTLQGEYVPSPSKRSRDQVEVYESSNGREGNDLNGMPVIIVTCKGAQSGALRKVPLMRVEHDGEYLAVASMGGAPKNPVWYYNLKANPDVQLQDQGDKWDMTATELPEGDERAAWWDRAVAAYPPYADYQKKTDRRIPVFLLSKKS
ncbi:deazaflavin-dependent oxidoreductase (nitroreductase family) [Antricoccus suffuscus]|uniref:Deazaflavin-dependent oxidoreductase (Nitroreductase family) n=1 Tax=Antricoccus suffuscus TaxID=1629062 RepID=A0A2T0ZZW6_9ACTN|nr:nitroreductase family deazaflavin-dependent oxidoreductase [Antricoccus suffuscus]PRZ41901.1 deazaflavin-dependent oxidoreductase (nitroreductase family) [Antricoccus suffuscus]